jgi:hypothetical protein
MSTHPSLRLKREWEADMNSRRLLGIAPLLLLLALSACLRHDSAPPPPTPTRWPTATPHWLKSAPPYWDGAPFGDEPVVSVEHGVSQAAHDRLVACGYTTDHAIVSLLEDVLGTTDFLNPRTVAFEARDAQGETLSSVTVTVEQLALGVFRVTCSGSRASNGD